MTKQLKMLNKVMDIISEQEKVEDASQAFDAMLQYVAYKLSYETMIDTPWLKQDVMARLDAELDLNVLREDMWDWFGEIYEQRVGKSDTLIPRNKVQQYVDLHYAVTLYNQTETLLDPYCGTGRLILAVAKKVNDPQAIIYYGAEPDLLAYRIALLNIKLYGLQARIINLNSNRYDVRSQSPNWKFSNSWFPVASKKFFTVEEVENMDVKKDKEPPSVYYA